MKISILFKDGYGSLCDLGTIAHRCKVHGITYMRSVIEYNIEFECETYDYTTDLVIVTLPGNYKFSILRRNIVHIDISREDVLKNNYYRLASEYFGMLNSSMEEHEMRKAFKIEKVIFNNPATIVIWKDGTKTVVKCQDGDKFNKETGLALCFMKKALGNQGNFNDILKEWCPEEDDSTNEKDK